MPSRLPNHLMGLALALTVLGACSGQRVGQVEKDVRSLKEELVELRRGQSAQRVQFDEFRNRLVVLQDKLDSERLARTRRGRVAAMPQLPHVVVPPRRVQPRHSERRQAQAPLPAAGSRHQGRASRSIVIGPDNVPHVTDTQPKKKRKSRRTVAAGPRSTGASNTPQGGLTREERAAGAYRTAKAQLDGGRLRDARTQFQRFLTKHPKHPLADNAMYWIGETWYAQALWIKAARVFHDVTRRFPLGNKVPDAMLKMALCYQKLGERNDAAKVLRELIRLYPVTPAAELARRKLRRAKMNAGLPAGQL
ncbi:MAG: tol-pal system protein YbgF [Myxococcales bacterium]|nr:tol-pal system protein YbgF [Myxococcales bacterium]